MEYLLVIAITLAGIKYEFVAENTHWTLQECDELAETIQQSFAQNGTAQLEAYCMVKI